MGNKGSFEQHFDFRDISKNYTFEKKINDGRFGEIKVLKEKVLGQKVLEKDFSSNTPQQLSDYIEEIKICTLLDHPHILKIYGYNAKKEDMFCSDFYKVSLFMETFDSDLEQEIQKRFYNKEYYPEVELWFILDCVASACAYFQNNKIIHRDIRPYNILITSNKEYKIAPSSLFKATYNPLYFDAFNGLEAESRYYSPELLKYYNTPVKQRVSFDEYQSDVFSLGMTLLELALLERPKGLYDFERMYIREDLIKNSLEKLKFRYSENFVKTLEAILDFNPRKRLDFIRLDTELGVYRKDIRENARGIITPRFVQQEFIENKDVEFHKSSILEESIQQKVLYLDDLEQRVQDAVQRTEQIIKTNSPPKSSKSYFDDYDEHFLYNNSIKQNQPTSQSSFYKESETQYYKNNQYPDFYEYLHTKKEEEIQPKRYAQPHELPSQTESLKATSYIDNASAFSIQRNLSAAPLELFEDQGVSLTRNMSRFGDNFTQSSEKFSEEGKQVYEIEYTPSWRKETIGTQGFTSITDFNQNINYVNNIPQSLDFDINTDELSKKVAERLNLSKQEKFGGNEKL